MVFLIKRIFWLAIASLLLSSCAKIQYLAQQGYGQLKLLNSGVDNEVILKSVRYPKKTKQQISNIIKYKEYFFTYFKIKPHDIYSKTVFLEQKAVTYLVITAPLDKIKAHEECFGPAGCFPYLGFFAEDDAKGFAEKMQQQQFSTYIRPVYAYSTLGYFEDNILSSFFYYNEQELAQLIFHELFHTVFFAKNEIDLNESMASYFAQKMVAEYFSYDGKMKLAILKKKDDYAKVRGEIVKQIAALNNLYLGQKNLGQTEALKILKTFITTRFNPHMSQFCQIKNIAKKSCLGVGPNWNNARFAAYLTYSKDSLKLAKVHSKLQGDLRSFLKYIQSQYKEYKSSKGDSSFSSTLFSKL